MKKNYLLSSLLRPLIRGVFQCLLLALTVPAFGQVAGTTNMVSSQLSFSKTYNNVVLDPTPNTGAASRVQFLTTVSNSTSPSVSGAGVIASIMGAEDIEVPDWLFDLTGGLGFFCSGLEPSFSASVSIDVGGYYETHSIGKSKLAFNYPVKLDVIYPEANTFGCGDVITIRTAYTLLPNANKLLIDAPFVNQEIGPILDNFAFDLSMGINAHVGFGVSVPYPCPTATNPLKTCTKDICGDKLYFNESLSLSFGTGLPSLPPLVNICENAFGPGANESSLLSCNWSGVSPLLYLGQFALDTYNQQNNTNYTFATFPDQNTVTIAPPDLPSSASITIPEMEATFKNVKNTELSYSNSNMGRNLHASGSKSSVSSMLLDLVSLLDYSKISTSYSLGSGLGQADIGDISPTFTVDQHMNFNFTPEIYMNVDIGVEMNYSVFNANGTFSHSGFGRMVNVVAGQYIEAIFPQYLSSPTTVSSTSEVKGNLYSKMTQDYFRSIQLKVGEVQIPGLIDLTLVDETLQKQKIGTKTILEHNQEYSLGTEAVQPFLLDPENPVVEIDYVQIEDEKSLGSGLKAVVYSIGISNGGDVKLSDLRLDFNLNETYANAGAFTVECTNSETLALNTAYNGNADINLLAAGNTLEVDGSARVEILVQVKPEMANVGALGCFSPVVYSAKAKAYGVSPIGTFVENNYNHCTDAATGTDIIASVDLGAEVLTGIDDFTLYAGQLLKIDKPNNYGMGNIGSNGDLVVENSSFQGAEKTVIIGDIHVGGDLFLQGESKLEADYIQLAGKLKNPNWKSKLLLNGALSENSDCVFSGNIEAGAFDAGRTKRDIRIRKGKTATLQPGNYNAVALFENAELILLPGVYHIGRWAFLGDNITVKLQTDGDAIQLNLGMWQALGRKNTQIVIDGNGQPEDVIYNYSGNQKCSFREAFVEGRIIAPNAEIEFAEQSLLHGTCYAKHINFKTGSSFMGLHFLEPLNIATDCQDILIPGMMPALKSGSLISAKQAIGETIYKEQEIELYPNPTRQKITISGLETEISKTLRIVNSFGQLMETRMVTGSEMHVDLSQYPSGIYYIELDKRKISPVVKL